MSDKKIVIPREMLDAALAGYARCVGTGTFDRFGVEWALIAAFKWLAENPQVPTLEEYRDMLAKINYSLGDGKFQKVFAEWQSKMFSERESEPVQDNSGTFIDKMRGYTFNPDEANKIKEHVDHCTHWPRTYNSVAQIDAMIPDLLFNYPTHVSVNVANDTIREAFKRGKESK